MMDRMDSEGFGLWGGGMPRATWPTRLAGGVLAALGVLLMLALLTYQSAEVGWDALRPTGQTEQEGCSNWLGGVGLYTAAILYWLLGAGALYGAILLQVPAWDMMLYPMARRRGQWIAFIVMLITLSWAMAVQPWMLNEWAQRLGLRSSGGWIGYLGGNSMLESVMGIYWALELLILVHAVALVYLARLTPKALYRAEKQELYDLIAHWREKRQRARERKEREALSWRLEGEEETAPIPRGQTQSKLPLQMPVNAQSEPPAESDLERPLSREPEERQQTKSRDRINERPNHAPSPRRKSARRAGGENLLDLSDDADDDGPLNFHTPPHGEGEVERDDDVPEPNSCTRDSVRHPDDEKITRKPAPRKNAPAPAPKNKGVLHPTRKELEDYPLPSYELLNYEPISEAARELAREEMHETQALIIDTLESFNIPVQPGEITRGPSVTRYEFSVPRGQSVKAVAGKSKDIMAATQSTSVNILAPIPGKSTVGVELENTVKEPVYLRELLQSPEFHNPKLRIPVALGKDVYGNPVIGDLAAMPHVLVAGSTGSGKSVCINSMLVSFLYKFRPDELRLVLVDPKVVEMQPYKKLPHLAVPVVTDPTRVISALRWAVNEMEHRYKLFSKMGVRNLEDYNNLPPDAQPVDADEEDACGQENSDAVDAIVRDVEESQGFDLPPDDGQGELDFEDNGSIPTRLPYIVIVIDELADLMMQVKQDLEIYIGRLTQKARAAGLHLIVATQSPRAQVVTGIIKTNLPSRVALKVSSQLDSRVILDEGGAENLLGKGDLLYLPPGGPSKMARAQGAFVSDAEIASIISHCASHARQNFVQSAAAAINNAEGEADTPKSSPRSGGNGSGGDDEELYTRCVNLVINERKASTSLLQRRFSIGYGKAAKMIDMMEERGVISPAGGGNKAREVLVDKP